MSEKKRVAASGEKVAWKAGTMIYPLPAALISCGAAPEEYNVLTAAWVGTICSHPPLCYVSIRPERHSHPIIEKNMAFVINLTTEALARETDWCGVRSGRDYDKFAECGLTPVPSQTVAAPYLKEAPMCIECRVCEVMRLGSHDMFIADVEGILADTAYIDPESGAFDMEKAGLLVYSHGNYYGTGEKIGKFGWSVEKKRK